MLLEAIEAALISSYKRNFNTAQNVRVDINRQTGVIKVFARKTVVEEVLDPRLEISLDAAREINPNYQLDDIVEIEVTPRDFGRIAAQTAKQVVTQRIREAERGLIYKPLSIRKKISSPVSCSVKMHAIFMSIWAKWKRCCRLTSDADRQVQARRPD